MKCPKCGAINQDGLEFCRVCRQRLSPNSQQPQIHTPQGNSIRTSRAILPGKKARRILVLTGGCGFVLVSCIVVIGLLFTWGWMDYLQSPTVVEVGESNLLNQDEYTFSPEQRSQISTYGNPEAFTILFYQEETPDGTSETVRLETWDYYTENIRFTFMNGEFVAEDALEISDVLSLDLLPYDPSIFTAFMSLDEVIAATGITSYLKVPLYSDFIEGGVLHYADSLSFGLKDGKLVYVEGLAISNDE